ncbi:Ig-like domain-containing protein [Candidatus Palauibacter soopunensis]|uniref:Ig-like domain-containing protein n=1 Tax=Candidatus Palauibacter soopunensis TaxID=3056739 RepID=UPI002877B2AE|nr:Ig-like domain-containing protein [Candidatus Palauibacter soopunensis]
MRDQAGMVMSGIGVNWASSDGGIVTVDPAGLVTAVGNGATNVTATVQGGGASGGAAITVSQTVTALTVSPDQAAVDALETLQTDRTGSGRERKPGRRRGLLVALP